MQNRIKGQQGFTLIEILIVVVILGFLASTVGPQLFNKVSQAERTSAGNQIDVFATALDSYRLDNRHFPSTEQGLEALIKKPSGSPEANNWNGPYLEKKEIPKDPWGNEYQYRCPGEHNKHSYDLWSKGADNASGGEGEAADVTNW
ncbi:type II secretion system major pseudopilin GspG [Sporohalobacter salinus]|uniref:type II secretion system major pseudopilin GspG n=1 Tax=Sporohalobacter salinus TaxID=1494606 RepID=UPI00195F696E|nr:type II secretion system major pseudopilin GspG [Sporohalobacter salinus]MBM7623783.1 general secretion pathway protein G [Sporohalobacter salinus]